MTKSTSFLSVFSFFSSEYCVFTNLFYIIIIISAAIQYRGSRCNMVLCSGERLRRQSIPISSLRVVGALTSSVKNTVVMINGNKCSSSVEIGSTKLSLDNCRNTIIKKETVQKVKSIGGHVGLLITLMLYTAVGGLVSLETKIALSQG